MIIREKMKKKNPLIPSENLVRVVLDENPMLYHFCHPKGP